MEEKQKDDIPLWKLVLIAIAIIAFLWMCMPVVFVIWVIFFWDLRGD